MHWLEAKLARQKRTGRYRQRFIIDSGQHIQSNTNTKKIINFCSNDYLGLAHHSKIRAAFKTGIDRWGVGSGASNLITGYQRCHQELEEALAIFTQRPRALLFSSGYMANLAIATTLLERGDSIIEDKQNHASMIDAGQLCRAKLLRFQHLDTDSLDRQLAQAHGNILVMSDGVFSMDGRLAPLPKIVDICKRYSAALMVDDAHGFGILGDHGGGTLAHFNLAIEDVPILMGTFGKALGTFGAFVAGSDTLIETLIQFGRTYIYTTALPPALATATLAALQCIKEEPWRRQRLYEWIELFHSLAQQYELPIMPSTTPIQALPLADENTAMYFSTALLQQGFLIHAIRPPTVPIGTSRLRITLSAEHSKQQIVQLVKTLARIFHQLPR